jgi:hypothetical protein
MAATAAEEIEKDILLKDCNFPIDHDWRLPIELIDVGK